MTIAQHCSNDILLFFLLAQVKLSPEVRNHITNLILAGTQSAAEILAHPGCLGCEPLSKVVLAHKGEAIDALGRYAADGIEVVTPLMYPEQLRRIFDPPPVLYVRGMGLHSIAQRVPLAIVGSRRSDLFGESIAKDFSFELTRSGAIIVSGLALGIDGAAHRGALKSGVPGGTVAVLGSGFHHLYPRAHDRLASEIIENGGALITQFHPKEPPYPSNFLSRNRIIAGLSHGCLVIQAAEKSGSLVTARYALEEGREVMAIPGAINDPRYSGSNTLIAQGAHLIASVDDIKGIFPLLRRTPASEASSIKRSRIEQAILQVLSCHGPQSMDELVQKSGLYSRGEALGAIVTLELDDLVMRSPGDIISLVIGEKCP